MSERLIPAWSLTAEAQATIGIPAEWPEQVTKEWAIGGATGEGVDVCILDSGVDGEHPLVGGLTSAVAVRLDGEETSIGQDELGDVCGHGTACAGIVRSLAPECRLHSVRVLGEGNTGSADLILGGLRYAIEQGFDVVNLSLSTTKRKFAELLHELADSAYFRGTVLVASAHNMPVESYPWRFSSVISVVREPQPAGRVLRPWHRHRRGVGGRKHAAVHGQQLRRPAHRGPVGARALEAPGADTLSAEERPLPDGIEHGRHDMTEGSSYQEAVAAGMLPSEESHRALLQSIVDVARAIFGAKASSIFLLDRATDELVFEAVSGEGEGDLVGMRIPSSTGIAGWVLVTGQPIVIDDLQQDPRFARQAAERTGYVPEGLMAVPLANGETMLGVLQVLDRSKDRAFSLGEIDLLILFANQAAIGLDLLQTARRARAVAEQGEGSEAVVARIAALLGRAEDDVAGVRLLEALETVLARLAS
jgi:subtilisin family serine protease